MIKEFEEVLRDYDIEVKLSREKNYDINILLIRESLKGKDENLLSQEIINKIREKFGNIIINYEIKNHNLYIKIDLYKLLIYSIKNRFYEFDKKDKKILIEHTSVNPNKSLHIGHLRNSILGDSLYRFLRYLGYDVKVLNYIDDTGSQVADIVFGYYFLGIPLDPKKFDINLVIENIRKYIREKGLDDSKIKELENIIKERLETLNRLFGYYIPEKFDSYSGDIVYYIVNKLYEIYPELEKEKNYVIKKIEEGNNEIYNFSRNIVNKIILDQLYTLSKFNIYYDLIIRESDVLNYKLWDEAFEILKKNNIIKYQTEGEKKGTWIIDLSKWDEFKNYEDKEKVLIRSDGTTVYLAKDIALAMWKTGILENRFKYKIFTIQRNNKPLYEVGGDLNIDFSGDISINIIGNEQRYLQLIIKKIIENLNTNKKYIHYGYGLIMLSKDMGKLFNIKEEEKEMLKMSGRKGLYINVDSLIDVMKKELKNKFNLDDERLYKLILSSIAFEILKYDKNSVIAFDLNKMMNINEGTALYLLYTYARINSLLEKFGKNVEIREENPELNNYERELIKEILIYRDRLLEIEKNLEINKIADYTLELARKFNEFYQNVPILPEIDKKYYRIILVYITKILLEKLFDILKIEKIDKI